MKRTWQFISDNRPSNGRRRCCEKREEQQEAGGRRQGRRWAEVGVTSRRRGNITLITEVGALSRNVGAARNAGSFSWSKFSACLETKQSGDLAARRIARDQRKKDEEGAVESRSLPFLPLFLPLFHPRFFFSGFHITRPIAKGRKRPIREDAERRWTGWERERGRYRAECAPSGRMRRRLFRDRGPVLWNW